MNKELYNQSEYWKGFFINDLLKKYNKKSYLELGVWMGHTWSLVNCEKKVGVDLNPLFQPTDGEIQVKSTDQYFEELDKNYFFDLIFIDAWHEKNQVKKDFINSFNHLNKDGIIVMHDINPMSIEGTSIRAHGDCFELWLFLNENYRTHLKTMKGAYGDTVGLFFKNGLNEINLNGEMNKGYAALQNNRLFYIDELGLN